MDRKIEKFNLSPGIDDGMSMMGSEMHYAGHVKTHGDERNTLFVFLSTKKSEDHDLSKAWTHMIQPEINGAVSEAKEGHDDYYDYNDYDELEAPEYEKEWDTVFINIDKAPVV